jgi:hypothetical protein
MARKVPWATITAASTTPKRKPAAKPKQESSIPPSSDDEATPKPRRPAQSKLKFELTPKKSRRSRSPSTSPIHGPPSAGPMRPGYEADDIYIMVEDELQAVAQTFTHHLHAAEYKRLKKKAREAPTRTTGILPRISPSAPKEVKRKFEVMALHDRQQNAVAGEMEEREKARDPWLGTSLAGLMGSTSWPKRTLMGSQEMQSSTRAASGFGRVEGESPSKKMKTGTLELLALQIDRPKQDKKQSTRRSVPPDLSEPPMIQRPETTTSPTVSHRSTTKPSPSPISAPTTTITTPAPRTKTTASARPARKKFIFDDNFDIESLSSVAATDDSPESTATATKRKVKTDVKGGKENKKTKLSDIPMFLV